MSESQETHRNSGDTMHVLHTSTLYTLLGCYRMLMTENCNGMLRKN